MIKKKKARSFPQMPITMVFTNKGKQKIHGNFVASDYNLIYFIISK